MKSKKQMWLLVYFFLKQCRHIITLSDPITIMFEVCSAIMLVLHRLLKVSSRLCSSSLFWKRDVKYFDFCPIAAQCCRVYSHQFWRSWQKPRRGERGRRGWWPPPSPSCRRAWCLCWWNDSGTPCDRDGREEREKGAGRDKKEKS